MADIKIMNLRRDGICECGAHIAAGQRAGWDRGARIVICTECLDGEKARCTTPEAGSPGASLAREYEKRRDGREKRIRDKHPKLGGLILALSEEPASTRAFAIGAKGEREVGERLEKLCGDDVLFLHNRRRGIDRRDGDIDHIAVAPSGIFIIDPKAYRGAKVRVRRSGGLFSDRREQLFVRGRDRTNLLNSLEEQETAVRMAMATLPVSAAMPLTALLCFIDADFPMISEMAIRGYKVIGPRATGRLVNASGPWALEDRRTVWQHLATQLPSV